MSPTILIFGKYRFFFNSREEKRMHVHVQAPEGVAKFWLEPIVSLAGYYRINKRDLKKLMQIVEDRQDEFKDAWKNHFGR
jgi:hypothetical protein